MEATRQKARLLWVGDLPAPAKLREAAADRWVVARYRRGYPLAPQLDNADVAVLQIDGQAPGDGRCGKVLQELADDSAITIVLLPEDAAAAWNATPQQDHRFIALSQDLPTEELKAKLAAIADLKSILSRLRADLALARSHSDLAGETVANFNEEMRLAARLQHDFLPRRLPTVGPVRFGALYRPASWVSGDMYDIVRLDEMHVGFYVADVVGHGMPAALLTMFIKKALQTKQIVGHSYEIIPPHVSLAELNTDICEQKLTSCQFCTAVYCVLDTQSLTLEYSRAGHPQPVLFRRDGTFERLSGPGSLLGIFPGEQYVSCEVNLHPGDRVVVYSDGAEDLFRGPKGSPPADLARVLAPLAALPCEELLLRLTERIDTLLADADPEDDITVVIADIAN